MDAKDYSEILPSQSTLSKYGDSWYFLGYDYQTKQAARKERPGEEETWALFKFYPIIEVLALSPLP